MVVKRYMRSTLCQPPNKQLQPTARHKVPRHKRHHAAPEPGRYTVTRTRHSFERILRAAISALRGSLFDLLSQCERRSHRGSRACSFTVGLGPFERCALGNPGVGSR